MSSIANAVRSKKHNNHTTLREVFVNESGAIDLASIMVGIIVIGLIGGVIAATVFTVIPWAQDNAAKQQLDVAHTAESTYSGIAITGDLPVASLVNASARTAESSTGAMYGDKQQLDAAGYLSDVPALKKLCVTTQDGGENFSAAIRSDSGNYFVSTNAKPQPVKVSPSSAAANSIIEGCLSAGQVIVPASDLPANPDPTPDVPVEEPAASFGGGRLEYSLSATVSAGDASILARSSFRCDINSDGSVAPCSSTPMMFPMTGTYPELGADAQRILSSAAAELTAQVAVAAANCGLEDTACVTASLDAGMDSKFKGTQASGIHILTQPVFYSHW